ncbi:hypothetical protein BESB_061950 [Besnoitia besnoiti]|uniref:Plant heme peroxidase family profile domain-containing protein n=1 Tax=Besnoitia besnoiti TaxID=94643 RepID=A0A2A9MA04_BESBE|nr:hypothetical protein BESB_061950 [Besnoitia besnoiti]PFH35308.1 hypothetical protein BESB_061950 [Besnoitia besnoiti]
MSESPVARRNHRATLVCQAAHSNSEPQCLSHDSLDVHSPPESVYCSKNCDAFSRSSLSVEASNYNGSGSPGVCSLSPSLDQSALESSTSSPLDLRSSDSGKQPFSPPRSPSLRQRTSGLVSPRFIGSHEDGCRASRVSASVRSTVSSEGPARPGLESSSRRASHSHPTYSFDAYPPEVFSRWKGRDRTGASCGLAPAAKSRGRSPAPSGLSPTSILRCGPASHAELSPSPEPRLQSSGSPTALPSPLSQPKSYAEEGSVARQTQPSYLATPEELGRRSAPRLVLASFPAIPPSASRPPLQPTERASEPQPVDEPRALIEYSTRGLSSIVVTDIGGSQLRVSPYSETLPRSAHPLVLPAPPRGASSVAACSGGSPEKTGSGTRAHRDSLHSDGGADLAAGAGVALPRGCPEERIASESELQSHSRAYSGKHVPLAAVPFCGAAGVLSGLRQGDRIRAADSSVRCFQQTLRSASASARQADPAAASRSKQTPRADKERLALIPAHRQPRGLSDVPIGRRDSMASARGGVAPPTCAGSRSLRHDAAVLRQEGIRLSQRDPTVLRSAGAGRVGAAQTAQRGTSKCRRPFDSGSLGYTMQGGGEERQRGRGFLPFSTTSGYSGTPFGAHGGQVNSGLPRGFAGSASRVKLPKWMHDYGVADPSLQTNRHSWQDTSNSLRDTSSYNSHDALLPQARPTPDLALPYREGPFVCGARAGGSDDQGGAAVCVADPSCFAPQLADAYPSSLRGVSRGSAVAPGSYPSPQSCGFACGNPSAVGFPVAHFICSNCGASAVPPHCPVCGAFIIQVDGALPPPSTAHLVNDASLRGSGSQPSLRDSARPRRGDVEDEPQGRPYAPYDLSPPRCRGAPVPRRPHKLGEDAQERPRGLSSAVLRASVTATTHTGADEPLKGEKSSPPAKQQSTSSSTSRLLSTKNLAAQVWGSPRVCALLCSFLRLPQLLVIRRCNKNLLVAAQFEMRYVLYATLQHRLREEERTERPIRSPRPKSCEPSSPCEREGERGRGLTPGGPLVRQKRNQSLPACPFNAETLTRLLQLSETELNALKSGKLPERRAADANTPRKEELRARARRFLSDRDEWLEAHRKRKPAKSLPQLSDSDKAPLERGLDEEIQLRREIQLQHEEELRRREQKLQQQERELLQKEQALWLQENQQRLQQQAVRGIPPRFSREQAAGFVGAWPYESVPPLCGAGPHSNYFEEESDQNAAPVIDYEAEPPTFRRLRHAFLKLWNYNDAQFKAALYRHAFSSFPAYSYDTAAILCRCVYQLCADATSSLPLNSILLLLTDRQSYLWRRMARLSGYLLSSFVVEGSRREFVSGASPAIQRVTPIFLGSDGFGDSPVRTADPGLHVRSRGGYGSAGRPAASSSANDALEEATSPCTLARGVRGAVLESMELKLAKLSPEFIDEFVLYGRQQVLFTQLQATEGGADRALLATTFRRFRKQAEDRYVLMDLYEWLAAALTFAQKCMKVKQMATRQASPARGRPRRTAAGGLAYESAGGTRERFTTPDEGAGSRWRSGDPRGRETPGATGATLRGRSVSRAPAAAGRSFGSDKRDSSQVVHGYCVRSREQEDAATRRKRTPGRGTEAATRSRSILRGTGTAECQRAMLGRVPFASPAQGRSVTFRGRTEARPASGPRMRSGGVSRERLVPATANCLTAKEAATLCKLLQSQGEILDEVKQILKHMAAPGSKAARGP